LNIKGLPFTIKGIEIDNEKIIFDKDLLELENGLVVDKDFTEIHFIGI